MRGSVSITLSAVIFSLHLIGFSVDVHCFRVAVHMPLQRLLRNQTQGRGKILLLRRKGAPRMGILVPRSFA